MLSYGLIGVPHEGHAEPGRTSDSRRGTRQATTLRNDPTRRPPSAARRTRVRGTGSGGDGAGGQLAPGVLDDAGGAGQARAVEGRGRVGDVPITARADVDD